MIAMPFDQQSYVDQYQRENIVRVVVKLNRKTDADILARLEAEDNRQGYIKRLIREDAARRSHTDGAD